MEITCAYCRGKGRDPFEVPSKLSACQVCAGRKVVHVKEPVERCIPCKGKGIFLQHRLPCTVCQGKGSVSKLAGARCQFCQGSGLAAGSALPCSTCYGLGTIAMRSSGAARSRRRRPSKR